MNIKFTSFTRYANVLRLCTGFVLAGLFSILSVRCNAQTLPSPDHIVILIEENQPNSWVIGNPTWAPYISALAADTDATTFTQMFAIMHPSQPNYLHFFSGDNQGVIDDSPSPNRPFVTDNLARQLLDKGLTFATYSQGLPFIGSDTVSAGSYVRKHNPVTNWVGTGTNQVPATMNQPFTAFPTDFTQLPTVCYVVPNEDSDMHNGVGQAAVQAGDYWMHEHLDAYIQWARYHNSLFIYTFDEDNGFYGNNISTVFFGPMVKSGRDSAQFDLHNMLRTIEDIYNLRYAGAAASSIPITNCWKTISGINSPDAPATLTVYPNPASSIINFEGAKLTNATAEISITDVTGRLICHYTLPESKRLQVNTSSYPAGLYFYHFTQDNAIVQAGKFMVAH